MQLMPMKDIFSYTLNIYSFFTSVKPVTFLLESRKLIAIDCEY